MSILDTGIDNLEANISARIIPTKDGDLEILTYLGMAEKRLYDEPVSREHLQELKTHYKHRLEIVENMLGLPEETIQNIKAFQKQVTPYTRITNTATGCNKQGYVYIYKYPKTDNYKIGSTMRHPDIRIAEAKRAAGFTKPEIELVPVRSFFGSGYKQKERELHENLSANRIYNTEWFLLNKAELKSVIENLEEWSRG